MCVHLLGCTKEVRKEDYTSNRLNSSIEGAKSSQYMGFAQCWALDINEPHT